MLVNSGSRQATGRWKIQRCALVMITGAIRTTASSVLAIKIRCHPPILTFANASYNLFCVLIYTDTSINLTGGLIFWSGISAWPLIVQQYSKRWFGRKPAIFRLWTYLKQCHYFGATISVWVRWSKWVPNCFISLSTNRRSMQLRWLHQALLWRF